MMASACDLTSAIESLLRAGASINARDLYGNTALHYANIFGAYKAIEMLEEHNADVNIENNNGKLPLDVAGSEAERIAANIFGTRKRRSFNGYKNDLSLSSSSPHSSLEESSSLSLSSPSNAGTATGNTRGRGRGAGKKGSADAGAGGEFEELKASFEALQLQHEAMQSSIKSMQKARREAEEKESQRQKERQRQQNRRNGKSYHI